MEVVLLGNAVKCDMVEIAQFQQSEDREHFSPKNISGGFLNGVLSVGVDLF